MIIKKTLSMQKCDKTNFLSKLCSNFAYVCWTFDKFYIIIDKKSASIILNVPKKSKMAKQPIKDLWHYIFMIMSVWLEKGTICWLVDAHGLKIILKSNAF